MAKRLLQSSRRSIVLFILTCLCIFSMYLVCFEMEVTRHCHRLCNSNIDGPCYKKNYAVIVYTDDTPVDKMNFEQSDLPKLRFGDLLREFFTGRLSHENCVVQDYYPSKTSVAEQGNCAIVGNGGILLNSGCGPEINDYDFVMRANMAPIKSFESDVGSKTNLTILNYESLHGLYHSLFTLEMKLDNHDELLRRLRYLNDSILWFSKSMNYKETRDYLQSVAYVLKTHFSLPLKVAYTWQSVSIERYWHLKHYASSGFNLFAVAQTFCSKITLYGFYPFDEDKNGYRLRHHYYDSKPSEFFTKVHNIPAEFEILKRLHEENQIRLVTDPCQTGLKLEQHAREPKGDGEKLIDPAHLFDGEPAVEVK